MHRHGISPEGSCCWRWLLSLLIWRDADTATLLGNSLLAAHQIQHFVAHGGCAIECLPLFFSYGARAHAPQKDQDSMAHLSPCATELFQWRISLACATEMHAPQKKIHAPQNNLQVFWNCCYLLYKYRYITGNTGIYTGFIQI